MMYRQFFKTINSRHRTVIGVVLCLFAFVSQLSMGQRQDRRDPNRVYLEHSDTLKFDKFINPEAQILHGNVEFSHNGATLFCDSAHFYDQKNSFEAFGNVRMYQGDTLSLFSEYAYYDGNEHMAMARYDVVMTHREKTKLFTDSLNYDRISNVGYFFDGGRLEDGNSQLISDWGEYSVDTKLATFNYDVVLNDDRFVLKGDTLYYDTNTSWAHTVGPSNINSESSHIYTIDGYYNTATDSAMLYQRSKLTDKGKTMIGDTVYYNARSGLGEGFSNVVYTDDDNKNGMLCNYFRYNDKSGDGLAFNRAVALDYSQGDTLFLHADTFKIFTYNIETDSVYRMVHAYNKVRAFRSDVQAVCDSLVFDSRDSCLTMYHDPICWMNNMQLLGEEIKVYMKDSVIHHAEVLRQAFSIQQLPDTVHYNQVSSDEMRTYFDNGDISRYEAEKNVLVIYYPVEESDSSLIGLNYTETTELVMHLKNRKMTKIWMPKATGTLYPISQIPPSKYYLPNFMWFDYVRPVDKDDIFNWRPKKSGSELKAQKRREAPLQHLK